MLTKISSLLLFLSLSTSSYAQKSVSFDFDNDGKIDKMIIDQKDQEYSITYTLSTQKKTFKTPMITLGGQENSVSMAKNVIVFHSQYMRGENTYRFRYDDKLKQLKIIGFDNTQYGNATNDGSGTSSYNLSTGQYIANWNHFDEKKNKLVAVPKISKKYPLKNYTVNQLNDDVISQLQDVGYELLPSYMK
jgi:hypothetical protein